MNTTEKKGGPYRSRNSMISGVCAGLAEHFGISPFWVRIAAVFLLLVTGLWPTLILYLVATILMKPAPVRPFENPSEKEFYDAYTSVPRYTVQHIYEKFTHLDRRIQRMEDVVTTRAYDWDRKMNGHA